jgi:transposase InsO family protein
MLHCLSLSIGLGFQPFLLSWLFSFAATPGNKQLGSQLSPGIFYDSSRFTSMEFTKVLLDAGVQISMDGKGRVFDNIFSERLWRTMKVEEVSFM